jgi:N-acetylglucosaminyl-diphospho-decaprenol L-rhamnosyltransferase
MSRQSPTIDIIIVNWNAGPQIQECLLSLSRATQRGYSLCRIVVVDNASSDGSAHELSCPELPLTVIQNSSNRGFAAACNQGASGSTADYLLFLNPDTKIHSDALTRSVECMASPENANVGILGVQLLEKGGEISRSCSRFPTTKSFVYKMSGLNKLFPQWFPDQFYLEWDHLHSRQVEQVMGAYFFVRESLFEQVGGFDERFFLYFEEVDLSLRVRQAGGFTYYLATTQCSHAGGGSSRQVKARRLFYSLQSRIFYGFKNFQTISAITLLLATLFIEPISRIGHAIAQVSIKQIWEVVIAYLLLWQALPRILGSQYLRKTETLRLHLEVPHQEPVHRFQRL